MKLFERNRSLTRDCGSIAMLCIGTVSMAQPGSSPSALKPPSAQAAAGSAPASKGEPQNAVGEIQKILKPRAAGANAAIVASRPYEPIHRVDDEGQVPEIDMFVGESRVFPTPGVSRIAVGNGALLTASAIDNKDVILFANGAGTSSLFIWNADGRYQRLKINITPGDTSRSAREIAAFLSKIPKAKAAVVGTNIIVEGDGLSDFDLSKIDELAKRYPQIVNFTNRVGWEQMVLMDVKVVEFPVSYLREVGLKWNSTGGGAIGAIWGPSRVGSAGPYAINIQTPSTGVAPPITDGNGGSTVRIPSGLNLLSVLNLGLNAQLDLLEQEGKSTTLAEPQLSARNGSKASFTAGGEIPYAVQTRDGLGVAFKEYGVKLDITPKVDHGGIIRATIHAEVSSIDGSVSTPGGPALLLRKTDTEFNLRNGETMVLAGLLQREAASTIDKVPLLGDLPVLGAMFRSKRFQNKETEMVVFVTPTVVTANSAGNLDRVQRTNDRLHENFGPAPYLTTPLHPGAHYEQFDKVTPRTTAPGGEAEPAPLGALSAATPAVADSVPGASPRSAAAGTGNTVNNLKVLADSILRARPSGNSQPLLRLERGATVQSGPADVQTTSGSAWRNVTLGALNGWVLSDTVSAAAPVKRPSSGPFAADQTQAQPEALTLDGPDQQAQWFKVGKTGVPLRITPDLNAEILLRLADGEALVALPYVTRGGWTAVQSGEGTTARRGWIASQWIVPVNQ